MTVHVYSDSFVQDGHNGGEDGWPTVLNKIRQEDVYRNGWGGTGPNWSLKLLVHDLEQKERLYRAMSQGCMHYGSSLIHTMFKPLAKIMNKMIVYPKFKPDDSIIFLLSDQKRMEFPFIDNSGHADGVFLSAENTLFHRVGNPIDRIRGKSNWYENQAKRRLNQYKKYKSQVKIIANTLGPMFLYENVKNITFLHLLSTMFKEYNFIVFSCFSLDHYTSKLKNFNIKSTELLHNMNFKSLNSSNFYYVPTPISYMAGKQNNEETVMNHMTVEQNKNFALFCNTILNNEEPDSSWFANVSYEDPNAVAIREELEPTPQVFIYE